MCREKTIYISDDEVEFDVKEDCITRNEYLNIKYQISELEKELKDLQSDCGHDFVVVNHNESYNDDDGYRSIYNVQCQACLFKWEVGRLDFEPENFTKVIYK